MPKPNLFDYATSELSQDAFFSWIFAHHNNEIKNVPYLISKSLIELMIRKYNEIPEISKDKQVQISSLDDYHLEVRQQVEKIDILLEFIHKTNHTRFFILIEDKTLSGESREKQVEHYKKQLEKKNPHVPIVPVFLKTGYIPESKVSNLNKRKIVYLGYNEIYQVFNPLVSEMKEEPILYDWWNYFYNRFYFPVHRVTQINIDQNKTIKEIIDQDFKDIPHILTFEKITDYLFQDVAKYFKIERYPVQGQGHQDWHYGLSKENWRSKDNNIACSLYFIWNTHQFNVNVKTSPYQYKPKKHLSEDEQAEYIQKKDRIKQELKINPLDNWKLTNHFLQIYQCNNILSYTMKQLKDKLYNDIEHLSQTIDQAMNKMYRS